MQLADFDFPFDSSLIASEPVHPRDHARLLIVPRAGGVRQHKLVKDLPTLLQPGDVLVLNDTKVIPARLRGTKIPGGGQIELLLVREREEQVWEVLLKGHVKIGQQLQLNGNITAEVLARNQEHTVLRFESQKPFRDMLKEFGEIPLPPYIKRQPTQDDLTDYQTVFARRDGAVAAPTAGLHFTQELFEALRAKGIATVTITLHVGPGTFRPVTAERIEDHRMDAEWYEVIETAARQINQAKSEGRRVVAVGTTAVRTLESAAEESGTVNSGTGDTRLFITPGYAFRVVDALMTNFHFPRTTLLMLVSAFAGIENMRAVYQEAVHERYRLYSYGDAMLIQ